MPHCKDKEKFRTSEAATKSWLRTRGLIDKFLNITNINDFRKEVSRLTEVAKNINKVDKGRLFTEKSLPGYLQAVPNREAFKELDGQKGIYYSIPEESKIEKPLILDKVKEQELQAALTNFLSSIGVTETVVDKLSNNAVAQARIAIGSIEYLKDQSIPLSIRAEEVSHFVVEILATSNSTLYNAMYNSIEKYTKYQTVYDNYFKPYQGNVDKIKKEVMGQIIADIIESQAIEQSLNDKTMRWWEKVLNWFKSKLGTKDINPLIKKLQEYDPSFRQVADILIGNKPNIIGNRLNKPTEKTLILRHGFTNEDAQHSVSGQTDISINEEGRKAVARTAIQAKKEGITTIITSPIERALESSKEIKKLIGVNIIEDKGLSAWDIGKFAGSKEGDFDKNYYVNNPDIIIEGGESFNQFKNRTIQAYNKIISKGEKGIAILSHGDNIRIWEAMNNNQGVWNESAKKDYLNSKGPGNAELKIINPSSKEEKDYYHIDPALSIENKLLEIDKTLFKKEIIKKNKEGKDELTEVYFRKTPTGDIEVKRRVTQIVDSGKKIERTSEEQQYDKYKAKIGSQIHADFENAIKRILIGENIPVIVHSNITTYKLIENYVKEMSKTYPEGTKFLSEIQIYDAKNDIAGTIDLLAVKPTGEIDIWDFKTISFSEKEKQEYGGASDFKIESWNKQLVIYRRILREQYGVKDFGKTRVIPVNRITKKDSEGNMSFIKIEIGKFDQSSNKIEFLQQQPLADEATGIKEIDTLLEQLYKLEKDIQGTKSIDAKETMIKKQRIRKLKKAIKELQLTSTINNLIDSTSLELKYISDKLIKKEYTENDLVDFENQLKIYSKLKNILKNMYQEDELSQEQKMELTSIVDIATFKLEDINTARIKLVSAYADSASIHEDPFAPQKELGFLERNFRNISQINHPIFKIFWNLVNKQKFTIRKETDELITKIKNKVDIVKSKGLSFDKIINPKTKNLISKIGQDYYDAKKKAINNNDLEWFKNNTIVDKEALDNYITKQKEFINSYVFERNIEKNKIERDRRISELEQGYDINKYATAWINNKNYFIKPKEENWLSPEYKALAPELKEFYNFFSDTVQELISYFPSDITKKIGLNKKVFIPNIEQSLLEALTNSGGMGIMSGVQNYKDKFKVKNAEGYGVIDPITGQPDLNVPIYYIEDVKFGEKSNDLGKVLAEFGKMAYNYKYMSEIEGTVRNLKQTMADTKTIVTNASGKVVHSKITDKLITKLESADNLALFNDYINYYVYGIQEKGELHQFEIKTIDKNGNEKIEHISTNKIVKEGMSWLSAKSLTLNLVSSAANFIGGGANAFMLGAKGTFYSKKNFANAMKILATGKFNQETTAIIEYFDIMGEKTDYKKFKSLSMNKLEEKLDSNFMYALQHGTDWAVQQTILLSMVQSHGLSDTGKIMKLNKLPEGTKSLLDISKVNGDKFNLVDLVSEDEYIKFRNKTQRLIETALGISSRDNINGVRLTIVGKALMQFRNWMPRMIEERFGAVNYEEELESITRGRYISFWQQVMTKRALPLIKEMIFGYGIETKNRSKELYEDYLDIHPEVNRDIFTEEAFYEMHIANLRAGLYELAIILTTVTLMAKIKPDDDKEKKGLLNKKSIKVLDRILSELTFYVSPDAAGKIIKAPLPLVSLLGDISDVISDLTGETVGLITNDKKQQAKNAPIHQLKQLFPALNEWDKWFYEIEKIKK